MNKNAKSVQNLAKLQAELQEKGEKIRPHSIILLGVVQGCIGYSLCCTEKSSL